MLLRYLFFILLSCQLIMVSAQTSAALPEGCYESNYTSTYTRCQLTFIFCFNFVQLKQCLLNKCERYIRAGDCRLQTSFILEQAQCYQSCCGSNTFSEQQCNQYNDHALNSQQSATTGLTIVLIIVAVILLAIMTYFATINLRCCDKRDPFIFLKFNIKWRKDVYQQTKCDMCRTYGAMLVTPCRHNFHVSCFQDNASDMICPTCSQKIRERLKIYCFLCRQKSFKVKIGKIQDINDAIAEGKALHFDLCPKQIRTNLHLGAIDKF